MAVAAVRLGQRLETLGHLAELRGIHQQESRTDGGGVPDQRRAGFAGDGVVSRHPRLRVRSAQLGRLPHPGEQSIARSALRRELAESLLGLRMLALIGQLEGRLVGGAGFGGLAGLPELVAAPRPDGRDDENGRPDDEVAVALPQLLELFSPYFLVDFIENIRHETPPPAGARPPRPNRDSTCR